MFDCYFQSICALSQKVTKKCPEHFFLLVMHYKLKSIILNIIGDNFLPLTNLAKPNLENKVFVAAEHSQLQRRRKLANVKQTSLSGFYKCTNGYIIKYDFVHPPPPHLKLNKKIIQCYELSKNEHDLTQN